MPGFRAGIRGPKQLDFGPTQSIGQPSCPNPTHCGGRHKSTSAGREVVRALMSDEVYSQSARLEARALRVSNTSEISHGPPVSGKLAGHPIIQLPVEDERQPMGRSGALSDLPSVEAQDRDSRRSTPISSSSGNSPARSRVQQPRRHGRECALQRGGGGRCRGNAVTASAAVTMPAEGRSARLPGVFRTARSARRFAP